MATQLNPPQKIEAIRSYLQELGCELRTVTDGNLVGPDGEAISLTYFYNPQNNKRHFDYFEPDETIGSAAMKALERALGISFNSNILALPKTKH